MPVELPALFYVIPRNPAIAVGLPLAFGMASGFITKNSVNTWYPTLKKPAGEPPRWAFPAAWTFLYCSMGLASHLIITNFDGALPGSALKVTADLALKLYWGQLGLNMLWTPLFFGLHKMGLALADISLLTPTTYALTYQAYKVDPRTAFALRRIFGGSSLAGSSTSTSLSSDALPSPISVQHDRSPPLSPVHESMQAVEGAPEHKKGWFGGLGGGLARNGSTGTLGGDKQPRSASAASCRPANSSSLGNAPRGSPVDDFDAEQLPFGGARSPPPGPTSPARAGHYRNASRSSAGGLGSAYGGSSGRPFSPEGVLAEAAAVPKDAMMLELLSGQAVIEAKDYDVLEWEDVQNIKKEHALLATRIASLTRSLALETRLRDSAAKLVRLSAPASSESSRPSGSLPASPSRPRQTREQAEAQLTMAESKLGAVQAELYKVGWKEAELRTKLLRHTAGVLALSARRKEEEEQGVAPTPLSPTLGSHDPRARDTPSPTGSGSQKSAGRGAADVRFDGAHFFAGNKEAIIPLPRSAASPYASPQPAQGAFGAFQHDQYAAQVSDLEAQVVDLQRQLEAARSRAAQELEAVRSRAAQELEAARKEGTSARDQAASLEQDVASLRVGRERAEADVVAARRDADTARQEASVARGLSAEAQRNVQQVKQEAQEANRKLRDMTLELAETEHKLEEAEGKATELEQQVETAKQEREKSEQEWAGRLEEAQVSSKSLPNPAEETEGEREAKRKVTVLDDDRRKVAQAIGDVLRRHRTRPTLGGILRETPSFDDTTERDDLPYYLASTLDSHFDRISSHVSALNDDLASLRDDQASARSDLEMDLQQSNDRHAELQTELDLVQLEKDSLEASLDSARAQSREYEAQLAALPALEQNLSAASAAEAKTREDLVASQSRITSLEAQLADLTAQQTKSTKVLQDLWKAIPPLDTRSQATASSDDLTVLKNAFGARKPLGNFIADITSGGKFSMESLAERIRLLLSEDQKLVQKLVAFEGEKGNVEKSRKFAEESSASLLAYEKKVKELEERIEVSSKQEVTMLERLNDLTESLEQTRGEKRKLETQVSQLQQQQPTPVAADHGELEELQDQIADLEEELKDAKAREQKVRAQLLEELSTVQAEVSSLKTQLRQAQRKAGK
ncbi:hypothetical protein JCM21900_000077 [Sporobolomyces salmonicolor]